MKILSFLAFATTLFSGQSFTWEQKADILWNKHACSEWLLSMDVLYWHPKANFTDLGAALTTQGFSSTHSPYIDFDWDFGFRAGVGTHFIQQNWDLLASYTRVQFATNFSSQGVNAFQSNFGTFFSAVTPSISGSYKISYETVEARLQSHIHPAPFLALHPGWGCKAIWINHTPHLLVAFSDGTSFSQSVTLSQKNMGLGPQAALGMDFALFKGWSLSFSGAGSLLFTKYRGRMAEERSRFAPNYRASNKEDKHFVTPNFDLMLGLLYEKKWCEANKGVSLFLGYESQIYLNQTFQMQNLNIENNNSFQGAYFAQDLSVYGVTGKIDYRFLIIFFINNSFFIIGRVYGGIIL